MLDRPTRLQEYQTYIDGKWCSASSGKRFETCDPYTGEPWALIPSNRPGAKSPSQIDQSMAANASESRATSAFQIA